MFNKNKLNIWESVSDMMTGMMMIFLFVSLAFMLQLSQISQEYYDTRAQIVADLRKEFSEEELASMHARINEKDGTVSFMTEDTSGLFAKGGTDPTTEYQNILNKFFPRYVNVLYKNEYVDNIEEIRIEGHASVESNESYDNQDHYFRNMNISQGRASAVLHYVMKMSIYQEKKYQDWFKKNMRAVGYSFSKTTGDTTKDRRVDFRVILNSDKVMNKLQNEINTNKNN